MQVTQSFYSCLLSSLKWWMNLAQNQNYTHNTKNFLETRNAFTHSPWNWAITTEFKSRLHSTTVQRIFCLPDNTRFSSVQVNLWSFLTRAPSEFCSIYWIMSTSDYEWSANVLFVMCRNKNLFKMALASRTAINSL